MRKQKRFVLKLDNAPHVNCIKDLIKLGKTLKFYKNIIKLLKILFYRVLVV